MKQHKRTRVESEARHEIAKLMSEMGLTLGEEVRVLSSLLQQTGKYIVRHERHGDYETPADQAAHPTPEETDG